MNLGEDTAALELADEAAAVEAELVDEAVWEDQERRNASDPFMDELPEPVEPPAVERDLTDWESFWLRLLGEYERVCEEVAEVVA